MRFSSFIPALAVLVTAVAGAALPRDNCGAENGCEFSGVSLKRDVFEHPSRAVDELTNAELLRRGLPLKSPLMRRGTPVRRHGPSSVPQPKKEHRGIIRIRSQSDNSIIGYVSKSPTDTGLYRADSNINNALVVKFTTDSSGSGTQLDLTPENSGSKYSGLFGPIQGRDDANSVLSQGSFQYLYLGNTQQTGPGAVPASPGNSYTDITSTQRTSESAVWTYDSSTGRLSPRWVNPDGSLPTITSLIQSTVLYLTGDSGAFKSRYPAPTQLITFEFVQN